MQVYLGLIEAMLKILMISRRLLLLTIIISSKFGVVDSAIFTKVMQVYLGLKTSFES